MKRCIILMMDSFGIGAASDAAAFGDSGADTLGHIVEWYGKHCPSIPFHLTHLTSIGLVNAHTLSTGHPLPYSIGTAGAHSTDLQSPETVEHLCAKCDQYAKDWQPAADKLWNGGKEK